MEKRERKRNLQKRRKKRDEKGKKSYSFLFPSSKHLSSPPQSQREEETKGEGRGGGERAWGCEKTGKIM